MLVHPFIQSDFRKIIGLTIVLLLAAIVAAFLVYYGNMHVTTALIGSSIYIGLLLIAAYFYWYIIGFLQVISAQLVVTVFVQVICIGITFMTIVIFELEAPQLFASAIPLYLIAGLPSWIILQQWYHTGAKQRLDSAASKNGADVAESSNKQADTEEFTTATPNPDILDRISVRNGAKIHIIRTDELLYVQAYGDYVMLFTDTDKYVKELTMKHLDVSLPESFVRIHRSYIVNTNFITRIELFGKETYQVRLKNGTCLRISNSGYKTLKSKLLL